MFRKVNAAKDIVKQMEEEASGMLMVVRGAMLNVDKTMRQIEELADTAVGRMERTTVRFGMKEDGYAGADQKMAGRA